MSAMARPLLLWSVAGALGGLGTGFLFDAFESEAMLKATRRAVAAFRRPEQWSALVRNGMTEDFSWDASAREYALLYKKALRPAGPKPSRRSR